MTAPTGVVQKLHHRVAEITADNNGVNKVLMLHVQKD